MPIAVNIVSKQDFQRWVAEAKQKFASADQPSAPVKVATADAAAQQQ
jgi:heme/copper-type cytochrome/quinol oxidase subunit 2